MLTVILLISIVLLVATIHWLIRELKEIRSIAHQQDELLKRMLTKLNGAEMREKLYKGWLDQVEKKNEQYKQRCT